MKRKFRWFLFVYELKNNQGIEGEGGWLPRQSNRLSGVLILSTGTGGGTTLYPPSSFRFGSLCQVLSLNGVL
jgi:hypothetical protein